MKRMPCLLALALAVPASAAENIDPNNDNSQFAFQENVGWHNAEPLGNGGPGVEVQSAALTGYIFAENVGWISLSCGNQGSCATVAYGVTNDGAGNLSGYAWGENVGWISFSCANQGSCATVNYGVTLDATGVFNGNAWGENVGWITFSDASPFAYKVQTSFTPCQTITLFPATLPSATVGTPYGQTITASGGAAPFTFAVTAGTLPPGLALAPGGVLSGTPTTAGASGFTVTATDANGCTGSRAYTLVVNPPGCPTIALSPAALPGGTVGVAYAQTVTASGGVPPYAFAVSSGALPPGLALASGGVLSGTPTAPGTFAFTITATDANACTGSRPYSIVVNPPGCPTITLSPATLPGGTTGTPYSQTITASGGAVPYTFAVSSGALPPGLTLASSGILSGTPSTAGTFAFTITATDASSCSGSRPYSITMSAGATLVDFVVGQGLGQPNPNQVRVFTGAGNPTATDFLAYAAGTFGVNVASGDVDGGTEAEIVTGPGPGAVFGPQVRAFRRDGTQIAKVNFFAYGTLKFGVNVASGNLDLDVFDEMHTGAGPGAVFGPHVRGWNFDATTVTPLAKISFFAYGTLKYGVNAGAGDVEGDGFDEILTGPGPGAIFGSTVRGFNYDGATVSSIAKINFNAYTLVGFGVNVAAGDVESDAIDEIVTAPGPGPTHPSRFLGFNFDGSSLTALPGYDVTPYATLFGARVGAGDVDQSGAADLLTGAGRDPSATSTVRAYGYTGAALTPLGATFTPFTTGFGVNVAGGELGF